MQIRPLLSTPYNASPTCSNTYPLKYNPYLLGLKVKKIRPRSGDFGMAWDSEELLKSAYFVVRTALGLTGFGLSSPLSRVSPTQCPNLMLAPSGRALCVCLPHARLIVCARPLLSAPHAWAHPLVAAPHACPLSVAPHAWTHPLTAAPHATPCLSLEAPTPRILRRQVLQLR